MTAWPSILIFHAAVAVLVNVWFPLLHHRRSVSAVGIGGSDVDKPGGSIAAAGFSSPGTQHEFCQNEEFRAVCGVPSGTASAASGDWSAKTSVVVMTSAYYGLMSIGRCVRKDYGFVGCGSVVLNIADRMCSGRRNCTVRVPNADMDGAAQRASCPDEFKNYLNVSYQCVDVISAPRNGCRQPIAGSSRSATSGGTTSSLPVITKPQGTFASIVTAETECGSHLSPWRVEVSPGQRLNFTLVDFAHSYSAASTADDTGSPDMAKSGSSSGDSSSVQAVCYAYAVFREGGPYGVSKSYTLCGGLTSSSGNRESTAYVSITEKVQLSIISRVEATDGRARHFLLRYTVIGCATPTTPLGGWVRRNGDQVTIGCNYTSLTWSLTCLGSKWIGTMNNCTIPENSLGLTSLADGSRLTFELALAAVVFIALLIAGVILCVGVAWIRRQAKRHSAAAAAAARGGSGRGPVTAGKLDRCLELHMPAGRSGQAASGGVGQDGGQTGYGMLPGASGRSPYGSHFRSIDSSDYIFRGGTGGDAGYDSTMTAPARTPLSLGGGSDFYRANSSSNDYAYIQDFGPPMTSSSSTSQQQQQMPPPTSSSSFAQRSTGMPNFPQTAIGTSVMIAALDGSGGDVVHRVPTCSDSMKRADSFGRIDENPPPSRIQHQQQLLRQPLLHQYRALPPQGAGCSDSASGGRMDLWERQHQHPQHRLLSSAALASFSPANEHCFDQE